MDDDASAIRSWADGDQAGFHRLVQAHGGLVRGACRRQAPAAAEDDCVQAVFLVLWRRGPAPFAARPVAPWLLTAARHVCARARRAAERRRRAEAGAAAGRHPPRYARGDMPRWRRNWAENSKGEA